MPESSSPETPAPPIHKLTLGEWYFAALCPRTEKFVYLSPDPHRGRHTFVMELTIVRCTHCGHDHSFSAEEISSRVATAT